MTDKTFEFSFPEGTSMADRTFVFSLPTSSTPSHVTDEELAKLLRETLKEASDIIQHFTKRGYEVEVTTAVVEGLFGKKTSLQADIRKWHTL